MFTIPKLIHDRFENLSHDLERGWQHLTIYQFQSHQNLASTLKMK
jgi:hypothetical protein